MNDVDTLSRLDFSLLLAFEALVTTSNVTRAAEKLHTTQSNASHALARLRDIFDDAILVRAGRGVVPTPFAEARLERVLATLAAGRRLVERDDEAFEPASLSRTFVIAAPDALATVLPTVLARLAKIAPGVRIDARMPALPTLETDLASGAVDVALLPADASPGLVRRPIGALPFAIASRRAHPVAKKRTLTKSDWLASPHVQVRTTSEAPSAVSRAVKEAAETRRVGFVAPGFLAAIAVVAETDFLFAAPRALVEPYAARFRLSLHTPPVAIPDLRVAMFFHERVRDDRAHVWFRDFLFEEIAAIVG